MEISQELANGQKELEKQRHRAGVCYVPPGAGRTIADEIDNLLERLRNHPNMPQEATRPAKSPPGATSQALQVKAYPTLLIAAYKANLAPAARVYLLLQAVDQEGRGHIETAQARALLSGKSSSWRIVGDRQLRKILAQGAGIFWTRRDDRLWLHGPARIAQALDAGRLSGDPVLIPVASLLAGIGESKAAFYAAWHAGRKEHDKPISRMPHPEKEHKSIQELTGVPKSTQRRYEQIAGIKQSPQWQIEPYKNKAQEEAHAWAHGRASFKFVDHVGKAGARGARYLVKVIPNTYTAPLERAPRGRQRKANRRIDLVNTLARGNGPKICRRYYDSARAAQAAWSRDPYHDRLHKLTDSLTPWARVSPKLRAVGLWNQLAALE